MYSAIPLALRLSRLFNKHSRHFVVRHLSLVVVLLLAVAAVFVFVDRSRALTNVDVTKANESVAHTRAGAMGAALPATTIVVNSTADTAANDGQCTLREAITSANSDTASGAAANECAAGSGADTITFDATVFAAPGPYTINLGSVLPDISTDITINGPGANLLSVKRNVATRFRIFTVTSGVAVNITGLTITGGFTADGVGLGAGGFGGGIHNQGTLTISNSTISSNQTGNGGSGAIFGGFGGSGGGIFNDGTLTISNSTISGNTTGAGGNSSGGPGSPGGGGGNGGGIFNDGTLTISTSTISGNTAGAGGSPGGPGGAGGGIRGNSGVITLKSTIVAGNSANSGPDIFETVQSDGFNLIQNTSGATINQNPGAGPNITGQDPLLGPLASNGGPTQTHALLPGSPAIDQGYSFSLTTDQRGQPRPFDNPSIAPASNMSITGDNSDIGAVEVNYAISVTAGNNQTAATNTAFGTQLKATVTESGVNQSGISVTFTAPGSGASGTFQGTGTNTATVTTNSSGVATAPVFTANVAGGSYIVTASIGTGLPTASFNLTNNVPPSITAAAGLSRTQGSPATNSQIATVTDDGGNGSVIPSVISVNPSNGVTISNISNTGGNITADIVADCSASNASFTLQASDGSLMSTATLNITVITNTAPTLTYTDPPAVALNGSLNINPATGPSDNGSVSSITVQSAGTYTGTISVDNTTGIVSVSNAAPAGTHTITIRATDNCSVNTNATFTLTVTPPTLGNYSNTTVSLGANTTITPDAAPTNTTGINVSTSTNFKGTLSADSATGVVRVTNASPAGAFTVKVTAFNSTGGTTSKTFQLTVQPGTACAGVPTFNNAADVNIGARQVAAAVGDFNNDGKQDIATVDQGNIVSIRLGDGMGGFTGSTNVSVGLNPQTSLAIGDFNSDGNQDFATANLNANTVSIRLGDGVGGFTGSTEVSVGNGPTQVAAGDFNNDGKQDLAVAHLNSPSGVSIRLGDGAGGFTGSTNITVGFSVLWVAIGDFNNDGKQDIATANPDSDNVSIRLGDGTGAFTGSTNIGVGDRPTTVTIGDFNNDGKQDLAATNSFSDDVSIRLGDGTGGFTGSTNIGVGDFPLSVAVGDFNNDGKQDFAADNFDSNTVSIRLGDGLGAFTGSTNISVGSSPYPIAIGDFNNDGKQDFVAPSGDLNTASVRLGGCNLTPAITAAPGLSRQQGSPASNSQIATVTDDGGNGNVIPAVISANPSNGVTISNIINTGGNVTANIIASCAATNASFTLQASDGVSTSTATLNVTVNANTAPALTYTNPPAVNFNGSTTVTPATATDNGSITGYSVQSVVPALTTPPTVDSSGVVSITNAQPAGTHTITIRATDNCGMTTDASFTLTVNKANTATALASSVNPSDFGQSVTFTATVTSGAGTPSGTVQFKDNGSNIGAAVTLNAGGVAQVSTSTLTGGTHTITADYSGDINFNVSTGTLSGGQVVKPQPTLSINDVATTEGQAGTKVLNFTVTLSASSSLTVTANFATANGTATAGSDYVATNGTLTFNPGDLTRTIPVTINGDVGFEPDETFFVNLSNPVNATISDNQGLGTIQNDDAQGGFISVGQANYNVSEITGLVTVTVTRTNDVSQAVNVDYATDDTGASIICAALNTGLASQRCDYTSMFGTLRFAANETQKTIEIPINLDAYTEGPEVFTVKLSNPTGGAVLAVPSATTVTISDSPSPTPNSNDDTTTFVRQQYRDFLNREADPAGLAFWKNNIDKCNDPAQRPPGQTLAACIEVQRIVVSAAFFLSLEFKGTGGLVRDFYVAALDRPLTNNMPDFVEFMRDAQAIQKGVVVGQGNWQQVLNDNRTAFMNEFVTRAEFVALYPTTDTPTQYVDKLYQHANVTGTQQERLDAIAYFDGAATAADTGARARALLQVTQSGAFQVRELNRGFVQMEYFGYLRRNANDPPDNNFNGYNFWLAKLNQFNGDFLKAEMVKAFLSSDEYRRRFGP